jgi:hypothetical protein
MESQFLLPYSQTYATMSPSESGEFDTHTKKPISYICLHINIPFLLWFSVCRAVKSFWIWWKFSFSSKISYSKFICQFVQNTPTKLTKHFFIYFYVVIQKDKYPRTLNLKWK